MTLYEQAMQPNWRQAHWALYWHVFYGVPRKQTLREMLAYGLSARQAIELLRDYESKRS